MGHSLKLGVPVTKLTSMTKTGKREPAFFLMQTGWKDKTLNCCSMWTRRHHHTGHCHARRQNIPRDVRQNPWHPSKGLTDRSRNESSDSWLCRASLATRALDTCTHRWPSRRCYLEWGWRHLHYSQQWDNHPASHSSRKLLYIPKGWSRCTTNSRQVTPKEKRSHIHKVVSFLNFCQLCWHCGVQTTKKRTCLFCH